MLISATVSIARAETGNACPKPAQDQRMPILSHCSWFEKLVTAHQPMALVSVELWRAWVSALVGTTHAKRTIASLAAELNLSWPAARIKETMSDHLHSHPGIRTGLNGIGAKKGRVILLAAAHLTDLLDKENNVYETNSVLMTAAVGSPEESVPPIAAPKPPVSCGELFKDALAQLTERQRLIVERRIGLGCEAETLVAIGNSLGLTRERIRQIEAKALMKLRGNAALTNESVTAALMAEAPIIWTALAGADGVVRRSESDSQHDAALASEHRLALWLIGKRPAAMLDALGQRVGDGWLPRAVDRYEVDRALHAIEHASSLSFPVEAEFLAKRIGCSMSAVRRATALAEELTEYSGYICRGAVQSRTRRAVWLHRLLAGEHGVESLTTRELVSRHNALRPHEQCSIRDADIVLLQHHHMFLAMGKDSWRALGGRPVNEEVSVGTEEADPKSDSEENDNGDETICGHLRQIFMQSGPLHMSDVDREFEEKTSGRYSVSGMRALLLTSGRFSRLAPGVYALPDQIDDEQARRTARALLLNEESCSQYVRARYAGEPRHAFPLWDDEMEAQWMAWGASPASAASPALLMSLLWVVRQSGTYALDSEFQPLVDRHLPPLGDILPALGAAMSRDVFGWVGINRILRRRQNDKTTLNVLAILVGLGALQPSEDWRAAHRTTNAASTIFNRLAEETHANGRLTWHSELGASLRTELRLAAREDYGWLAGQVLLEMTVDEVPVAANRISDQKVALVAIQLGVIMAHADGRVDPREEEMIVKFASRGLTNSRFRSDVEAALSGLHSTAFSPESAKYSVRELKPSQRYEVLNFLLEVASADGKFCEREESFLRQAQQILDVQPAAFASLYLRHRDRPGTTGNPEEPASLSNVDKLIDLLMS